MQPFLPRAFAVPALAFAMLAQTPTQPPVEPPHHLVEVALQTAQQLQQLLALDLDLASCETPRQVRHVEVIATDQDLQRLQQAGLPVTVRIRNLEAWHAQQAARFPVANPDALTPPLGQGAMGGHYSLAQMEAILDGFHQQHPAICSAKASIGSSIENRSIWMVKISDNVGVDEPEPEVFYDALHHAREPLSMEATLEFMDWLLSNYGTDAEATFLVDQRELYFVPCVNPDGYEYNFQTNPNGGGMWRKNRRHNADNTYGVDLNRNYATAWNAPNGGSSATPSSDTYRGTAPFSEPETAALDAFVASRQFTVVFTTHTYQDVLLRPWGYVLGDPANVADYDAMGPWFTAENNILQGSISALLYIASGSAVDHHHTAHGAIAWTAELGRSNEGGFWPAGPTINAIADRHQPMFRKVALAAGPAFEFDVVSIVEAPGANMNGVVEPGESGLVSVTVRNRGVLPANATLDLQPLSAGLTVANTPLAVGAVPRLSTAATAAPLQFTVPQGFPGTVAHLRLLLSGDGRTSERALDLPLLPSRLLADDDFERDRGFARDTASTATTGDWERSAPQATVNGSMPIQPGNQTTPGGTACWVTDGRAGTGAGSYDVDGGFTDLLSPVFDLSHAITAEASFELWYAESIGDDAMQIAVSSDGGANWTPAYSRSTATGAWTRVAVDLGAPLSNRMRLRIRAQDLNPSLVECLIDDLQLRGTAPDGSVTLLGSGAFGTSLRLGFAGQPGALLLPLATPLLGPGTTFPGVGGALRLDAATVAALPLQLADAQGYAALDLAVPNLPALSGLPFHFQLLTFAAGTAAFGANTVGVQLH